MSRCVSVVWNWRASATALAARGLCASESKVSDELVAWRECGGAAVPRCGGRRRRAQAILTFASELDSTPNTSCVDCQLIYTRSTLSAVVHTPSSTSPQSLVEACRVVLLGERMAHTRGNPVVQGLHEASCIQGCALLGLRPLRHIAVEIDPAASRNTQELYPDVIAFRDIRKFNRESLHLALSGVILTFVA